MKFGKVEWDYVPKEYDNLDESNDDIIPKKQKIMELSVNEKILISESKENDEWWYGYKLDQNKGYFPAAFVKIIEINNEIINEFKTIIIENNFQNHPNLKDFMNINNNNDDSLIDYLKEFSDSLSIEQYEKLVKFTNIINPNLSKRISIPGPKKPLLPKKISKNEGTETPPNDPWYEAEEADRYRSPINTEKKKKVIKSLLYGIEDDDIYNEKNMKENKDQTPVHHLHDHSYLKDKILKDKSSSNNDIEDTWEDDSDIGYHFVIASYNQLALLEDERRRREEEEKREAEKRKSRKKAKEILSRRGSHHFTGDAQWKFLLDRKNNEHSHLGAHRIGNLKELIKDDINKKYNLVEKNDKEEEKKDNNNNDNNIDNDIKNDYGDNFEDDLNKLAEYLDDDLIINEEEENETDNESNNNSNQNNISQYNTPISSKTSTTSSTYYDNNNNNNPEDLICLHLKVFHSRYGTGFQPTKNIVVEKNDIIADRYQIKDKLGEAAFSRTYHCYDLKADKFNDMLPGETPTKPINSFIKDKSPKLSVCLKIIKNNKDYFDQSLDEIKILRILNRRGDPEKQHFLRLFDFFYYKEHLFIVSELLKENLYDFFRFLQENNLPPYFTLPRLQKIMRQCLSALEYVHKQLLIHCDIKPENIVIKSYSRCEIKIIDFGSSCFVTDHLSSYVQSRAYRSPEVILGLHYDQRIDIWSLGAVLAELYTGNVLFLNDSLSSMLARIQGILGPIPKWMIEQGRQAPNYFTTLGIPFEQVTYDGYATRMTEIGWYAFKNRRLLDKDSLGAKIKPIPEDKSDDDLVATFEKQNMKFVNENELFLLYYYKPTSLRHRLHIDKGEELLFLDFIHKLLSIDPHERFHATDALQHPWILEGIENEHLIEEFDVNALMKQIELNDSQVSV